MIEQDRLRVRSLFAEAVDLPREQRAAFLDAHCSDQPDVRTEVEELLAYDSRFGFADDDDGFLESVGVRGATEMGSDARSRTRSREPGLPARVGRYRILSRHGEGGMGTVFEAEQDNPRRIVALKVIRSGLVAVDLVSRFKHEAQILARLHHPGIAQVYEAGMCEDGRPFFAMEFIRGMPLDQYAHACRLDTPARLELVAKLCDAVQHAHDRGVVHRDLKPGNILVEESGQPKVLDFGVAHVTAADLLTTSSHTRTGQLLGTWNYMSPEQFTSRPSGLDGRSDVYTLGVLLFELLAHRSPYHLEHSSVHEIARAIEREEPTRLSVVDRRFRGDVEVIVSKALEKEKARRYASAWDLASDIRRHLRGEPIRARQVSTTERCWRWARRNPTIAALGAGLATVLVVTTLASLIVANRMGRLARNEKESRAAAQAETYRAVLSEVKALRAGRQPGWRAAALSNLARLATMPTPRRNLTELRTEAAATLKTPDIRLVAKVRLPFDDLGSFGFSDDGRILVTGGQKTGLEFWDVAEESYRSSAEGLAVSESFCDKTVYLPDGQGLAVATRDHGVVFTDAHGNRTGRAPITQRSSRPWKLALSADGRRIAVAWTNGAGVTVHDTASGVLLERFDEGPFALSPNGQWLARPEFIGIVLRPISSGERPIVLGHHRGALALAFSPDGALLAAALQDDSISLWNVATRELVGTLRGHRERVVDVAFSPDGEWIATGGADYTARIWETRTGQNLATLPESEALRQVKWSPAGDYLATRTNSTQEICLYRISGRYGVQQWLTGHDVELARVATHPQQERIATTGYGELSFWDLSASRPSPLVMEPNPGAVTGIAYSPDGSLLATACWVTGNANRPEGVIAIRDANTGKILSRFTLPQITWTVAFDSTGTQLACGDMAGNIVIWDLVTNRGLREMATTSDVRAIACFDRPRALVTHGKGSLLVFDIESGERTGEVNLGSGDIRRFLADRARNRLVVGFVSGAIGSVSFPDLISGPRLEHAHHASVDCLALSPDGRLLATGGADHRVVLRDAVSFEELLDFPLWVGNVRDLTFDLEGRRLAVVGTDCNVDLWNLAALYDGLTDIGLAWDRPAPVLDPTPGPVPTGENPLPAVPVIRRPGSVDPGEFQRARSLVESGAAAFENGRWAEAIRELEEARDQLQHMIVAGPGRDMVASHLGRTLVLLGSALRNEQRRADALAILRQARRVLETIRHPSDEDFYSLARVYGNLITLDELGTAPPTSTERRALADRAMDALRRSYAAGMTDIALIGRDHALDPLRERSEFRTLMQDWGFPRDPFASP
jgi:serine/threonine protein kinase/WD40 repeat protein